MKRTAFLFVWLMTMATAANAQPAAVAKVGKSVFTLTTFSADGALIASTHGVFVDRQGNAVSPWTPFIGAARAVCIDANGQQHEVEAIYGASELYDVCRFQVAGSTEYAPLTQSNAVSNSKVWLMGYSVKKASGKAYTMKSVETFGDEGYGYYILNEESPENADGCPFINQKGEVIGILQHSKTNDETHAVDARFANSFATKGLSLNDALLRQTRIRTALPGNPDDARLTLMMARERCDSATYSKYAGDFIRLFPNDIDGYSAQAQQEAAAGQYDAADRTMQEAINNVTNKDEAHSAYSLLIYQKAISQADSIHESWNLRKALAEATAACELNPLAVYQHQQAQITYSMGDYQAAYDQFMALTRSDIRNGELFYEAAQCRTQLAGTTEEILALLDSAINVSPNSNISAPYYLAKGRMLDEAGEYRNALKNYNKYDTLMLGRGSHEFYYIKYKCETKVRQYQQALGDIAHAIVLNRTEPTYYAEMASLQLRVNHLEDAIRTADLCIGIEPDYADPYIVKGIAQGELNMKTEALKTLQKAKELGDERAQELINKYK